MSNASSAAVAQRAGSPHIRHLDDLLTAQSRQRPDAQAILAPGMPPLTYLDLRVQADQTAQALRAAGVARGDRVALVVESGTWAAVAYLTTACAAAVAPLDPTGRAAEYDFLLSDMDAKAVIVERGSGTAAASVARAQGRQVVELVPSAGGPRASYELAAAATGPARPATEAAGAPSPSDVAFVLHTSGTTGRPKLVAWTHEMVCTSARNIAAAHALDERDRCLNVLPLFHGHGLMSPLLATLWAGASVVCPRGFDPSEVAGLLHEFRPTWYTAVPVIHQAILSALADRPDVPREHCLRFVRSASSALPGDLLTALEATFGVPVLDSYGMTEACSIVTSNPLPPGPRKRGSVGVSVGNDIVVLDDAGQRLPPHASGEIAVRGRTVIDGYEHNPAANATAFVDGWFRTGDYGHLDEDGYLFVTGRIKEIINRGGTKISPSEVDEALLAHPAVVEAAAFALPHATLGEEVAAAVVLPDPAAATDEEIRAFLAERLAAHKVPRQVFRVASLPRTSTGKVQRAELAARLSPTPHARNDLPGTPLESTVAGIWTELLGVREVGLHEHFFDLGGNSLLIKQLQVRLAAATGRTVPVVDLFAHPTVKTLSEHLADLPDGRVPPRGPDAHAYELGGRRLVQQRDRRRRQEGHEA